MFLEQLSFLVKKERERERPKTLGTTQCLVKNTSNQALRSLRACKTHSAYTEWKFSGCWPLVLMTIIPPVPSSVVTQDSSAVPLSMHLFAFIRKHFPGNRHPMSLCACEWIEWEEGRVVEDFFFLFSFFIFWKLSGGRGVAAGGSSNCYNQSYFEAKN